MDHLRDRELRKNLTEVEKKLWRHLRLRQIEGCKFRRQQPVGPYIVDFICCEKQLIVELDGGQHAEQVLYDAERTAWLESEGFRVLRFWNNQVMEHPEVVTEVIHRALLEETPPTPTLPPKGGGRYSLHPRGRGNYFFPHETRMNLNFHAIADDVKLGHNVMLARFINLYGCAIGDDTKIGTFVEIQKNARVGNNCKISSHTFICEGVTIEDNVFVGHNVTFINDTFPRATTPDGALQTEQDWKVEPTRVKKGASIGSGVTILSNVVIGENAIVGAGSVVTRSVPPEVIVAGNPARVLRGVKEK